MEQQQRYSRGGTEGAWHGPDFDRWCLPRALTVEERRIELLSDSRPKATPEVLAVSVCNAPSSGSTSTLPRMST